MPSKKRRKRSLLSDKPIPYALVVHALSTLPPSSSDLQALQLPHVRRTRWTFTWNNSLNAYLALPPKSPNDNVRPLVSSTPNLYVGDAQ